MYQTLKIKMQT